MAEEFVPEWVRSLGVMAERLRSHDGVESTLATIVDSAANVVPGARWAGISVVTAGVVHVEACTDAAVGELDRIQGVLGEGPYAVALQRHRSVHITDTATDARWPRYAGAALEHGVRSALFFRLFVDGHRLGVLALYGAEARAFAANSLVIGDVLAQHASLAMVGAASEEQFNRALASRDVIGQAKGLLMQQNGLNGLQAFQLMLKTSQNANIKVVDIARMLVEQHETAVRPEPPK